MKYYFIGIQDFVYKHNGPQLLGTALLTVGYLVTFRITGRFGIISNRWHSLEVKQSKYEVDAYWYAGGTFL